jgi:flagellar P-ring protein precursor FlgI
MTRTTTTLAALAVLVVASSASAVKIADITRLAGQRTNQLMGWGLVVGLKGTGDGGDYLPAMAPLAQLLTKLADPTTVRDLRDAQNVALVIINVTLPGNGVRDGDRIDAYVSTVGKATSLRGGRLVISPLQGPVPGSGIFAAAQGPVVLEDTTVPTAGVIKGGCVMEADLPARYVENGRFTLILENPAASWTTASTIAKIINDAEGNAGETLAVAIDPKNVVVTIPPNERLQPDSFISRVQRLPVPVLATEARVVINERTGTITMTGDVEISPVVISHKGLTIQTVDPPPTPSPRTPVVSEKSVVKIDTTRTGGAKLQELVDALDALKVGAEERIVIIKELHKSGKLHAKLLIEGE